MDNLPKRVSDLLDELKVRLPVVLGDNLVGIYLCGSLTQDAFDPGQSDIDCEVVTAEEISEEPFAQIAGWLARLEKENSWTARLQMQFLLRDEVLTMNSKACLYQFGKFNRCGSDGNPITWMNILKSGITLFGPPASGFVPEITSEIFRHALVRETGYLRQEIENSDSEWRDVPKYRAYAVLTLCRILYSHATGEVTSKPEAAAFVMGDVSKELQEVIEIALSADISNWASISLDHIRQFIEFTENKLR